MPGAARPSCWVQHSEQMITRILAPIGYLPAGGSSIRINEVMTQKGDDWLELYNAGTQPVDLTVSPPLQRPVLSIATSLTSSSQPHLAHRDTRTR